MARRRKDIKKRRKVQEEQPASPPVHEMEEDEALAEEAAFEEGQPLPEIRDDQIVQESGSREGEPDPGKTARKASGPDAQGVGVKNGATVPSGWFGRYKDNLLLGLLVLYVLLLGLGTVGELFEIEWILNLPLFR